MKNLNILENVNELLKNVNNIEIAKCDNLSQDEVDTICQLQNIIDKSTSLFNDLKQVIKDNLQADLLARHEQDEKYKNIVLNQENQERATITLSFVKGAEKIDYVKLLDENLPLWKQKAPQYTTKNVDTTKLTLKSNAGL